MRRRNHDDLLKLGFFGAVWSHFKSCAKEYHRLMSSVRPLLFTLARCTPATLRGSAVGTEGNEAQKREVAATRMQLLHRMRCVGQSDFCDLYKDLKGI